MLMFFANADRKVSQTNLYGISGGRSGSGTVQTSSVLYYCRRVASSDVKSAFADKVTYRQTCVCT